MKWRPEPGKWSMAEIVAHLADVEIVASWRMRSVIGANGTPIQPFDQDVWASVFQYGKRDPKQSLEVFRVLRENNLAMLKALPPESWDNYGMHAERGKESIAHLARMFAGHDTNHIVQIENIVAQLKTVGSKSSRQEKEEAKMKPLRQDAGSHQIRGRSRAAPEGADDPHSAARAVREMFTAIAPRYDLLNHVLSFNIDRMWWRRTARAFRAILARPDARILDLCCGTGDMTFALRRQAGKSTKSAARFSAPISRMPCCSAPRRNRRLRRWIELRRIELGRIGASNIRMDRSRCSQPAIPEQPLRSGDFGFRLPQSRRLRCRIARDRPCAASRRRVRHPGFRRAQGNDGRALPHLFQAGAAARRHRDFRRPRSRMPISPLRSSVSRRPKKCWRG